MFTSLTTALRFNLSLFLRWGHGSIATHWAHVQNVTSRFQPSMTIKASMINANRSALTTCQANGRRVHVVFTQENKERPSTTQMPS